jgi:deoxyribodipyrimidine photo-lyase
VLTEHGVILGDNYPHRLVDHEAAARHARRAIYSVREGDAYFGAARDIQKKHGSRTAGLPSTERRAKPKTKPKSAQSEFDF